MLPNSVSQQRQHFSLDEGLGQPSCQVAGQHIPAAALTAFTRVEDRLRALAAGYQKLLRFSEDQDFIPITFVDAQGRHGLYLGWE